jgi:excisionase family DNA binding protein
MTLDLKDRLYTSSEVAEILGVSLRSVYRYLEEGKLDADIKTATGRHRFSKKNILDFLQPGGITKDEAENHFKTNPSDEIDEEFNVLDLPAISKAKKSEENYDDFSFDLDEDFFKSLDFDSSSKSNLDQKSLDTSSNSPKIENGEFVDDDLERLLREFEEKEGILDSDLENNDSNKSSENLTSQTYGSTLNDNDDFDLDSFFKELEEDSAKNNVVHNNSSDSTKKEDFDFDFDLDFLDELATDEKPTKEPLVDDASSLSKNQSPKSFVSNSNFLDDSSEEDSEDNWLERFRKAAQKNSSNTTNDHNSKDTLKDSFFDSSSLDKFFDSEKTNSTNTIKSNSILEDNYEDSGPSYSKNAEYYYSSSLNGLKEIAQNVDKIAKKFDTDYAFTLNAGLSLHKPISPFTLIHTYVRGRDLELFEDYLNLNPVDSPSQASVCLIVPGDVTVFEDSYELHGLYVVSNVQLRSDLIDKGLDKLAREI